MRRTVPLALLALAALLASIVRPNAPPGANLLAPQAAAAAPAAFRIVLGIGDREPTAWDGKLQLSGGSIVALDGWRFAETDEAVGSSGWRLSTRRGPPPVGARNTGALGPMLDNGVIVQAALDGPGSTLSVETAQGKFSFAAREVVYGEPKTFLDGRARVDRVPASTQLTTSEEEQDHPALAAGADAVYLAFVEFRHGDRGAPRGPFREEPGSFDFLTRPVGGDQVMLARYSKASRTWGAPVPVSDPKQDVVRAAVAVDGAKRVWVFWSANRDGNYDIYGRARTGESWSREIRITSDPGTDLNPVAATDSRGRVWLAWQAFRGDSLEVLAAAQSGDAFTREMAVSTSFASDWDPSIAASSSGEVAVSWDTYDKGDYDVYFRRLRAEGARPEIRMDPPVPVAASRGFEARSSCAYDAEGRLWIAYEASAIEWGKDFGAYETSGIALYQGHTLRVKCFRGSAALVTTDPLAEVLPGAPNAANFGRRRRRAPPSAPPGAANPAPQAAVRVGGTIPNPELAKLRNPGGTPQIPPLPLNSFPRLASDAGGTVFLAFRSVAGVGRSPVGTVWNESIVYFDGAEWRGPIPMMYSDGLLDARPALGSTGAGALLVVAAGDHRQQQVSARGVRRAGGTNAIQTDLYASELEVEPAARRAALRPIGAEQPAAAAPQVKAELDSIAFIRRYRAEAGGEKLQLLRGEFHRHTEMSGDGGRDGPLIDAYRYMIDAAYMDWGGCCDHDNGGGREYFWWTQQKLTDAYKLGARYVPMFSYERSVRYPEGHRNVVMARRGVRPLPRLPKVPDEAPPAPAPDTQMLYRYLREFGGIVASHTSGTDMGTDWRDSDPLLEPVVEIYQGDRQNYEMPDAPRSNRQGDSIGGWRPLGFVSLALQKGYRLGFQASSDHISTHMSYCNLWAAARTREAIMDAFRRRRVYGATDNILADVRSGSHVMGEEFSTAEPPELRVKLRGTAPLARVHIVKDNRYVFTTQPMTRDVDFVWRDGAAEKGKTSYYYVRGEQSDGELVWVSPMWITYR